MTESEHKSEFILTKNTPICEDLEKIDHITMDQNIMTPNCTCWLLGGNGILKHDFDFSMSQIFQAPRETKNGSVAI